MLNVGGELSGRYAVATLDNFICWDFLTMLARSSILTQYSDADHPSLYEDLPYFFRSHL